MLELTEKIFTPCKNEVDFYSLKSDNPKALNVLFLGVMHGEEPQGHYLIQKFMDKCLFSDLKFKNNLYFLHCLNPDGMFLLKRGNSNDVDLNRNFPTKNYEVVTFDDNTTSGDSPASEIETRFLVNLVEKYKFDIILSIHAPFEIVNYDGNCEELAKKISDITSYPVQGDIGYPTPGSFGTYCGVERNIPIITLEVSEKLSNEELWEQNEKVFNFLANVE